MAKGGDPRRRPKSRQTRLSETPRPGPAAGPPPGSRSSAISSAQLLLDCRRKFLEVDEQARGLKAILEVSKQINSELDLTTILNNTMKATINLTGAERGYVVLRDENDQLTVRASDNWEQKDADQKEVAFSSSIVLQAVRTGEPVLATDAADDERFAEATSVKMMNLRAVMAAPIHDLEGRSIGAIYVDDPFHSGKFSQRSLRLLEGFADQVSVAIQTARLHEHLLEEKQRMEQMAIAREVQRRLIPESAPEVESFDIGCTYRPAQEVGGDLFQFVTMADGAPGVLIADVAGKGVPAALIMTKVHEACKMISKHATDPLELVAELNDSLCEDLQQSMMVTASLVVISPKTGQVRMVRAGHCPMGMVRPSRGKFEWQEPRGLVLGMRGKGWRALNEAVEVQLAPGDGVLLFTDGVLEAFNPANEEYGLERIAAYGSQHLGDEVGPFVEGLVDDVRTFADGAAQNDDIAIVYLRRRPEPE